MDHCEGWHLEQGQDEDRCVSPLRLGSAVQAASAGTLIGVVLDGAHIRRTTAEPTGLAMQGFADHLSDARIADLTTYVRNAWVNHAPAVDADEVEDLCETLRKPPGGLAPSPLRGEGRGEGPGLAGKAIVGFSQAWPLTSILSPEGRGSEGRRFAPPSLDKSWPRALHTRPAMVAGERSPERTATRGR